MRRELRNCGLRIAALRIGVLAVVLAGASMTAHAELLDRVLAVVGGQLITLTDVTAARDLGIESPGNAPDPTRAILSTLIDRELMIAEMERYAPPEPSADAVDREAAAVRARFPSQRALDEALAQSGIDETHLRETLRQNLRIVAYLDRRFATALGSAPADGNHRPVSRCAVEGLPSASRPDEAQDLQQVEARVADHRRDD
jgi:hypothetical protein